MFKLRRIVTGHDRAGAAVVLQDSELESSDMRPGAAACVAWSTRGFPVDNCNDRDGAEGVERTSFDDGTVFRVISYSPGVTPRNHRTNSVDYAVVLSGEIHMQLDHDTVVARAGDVIVQRGTIHNWINKGPDNCVMAFVLIGAHPVKVADRTLEATG